MPRAGTLKQILRSLSVDELKPIRKEYAPRLDRYTQRDGGKPEFVDALRRALKRRMNDGELSYEELMDFIRDELKDDGRRITTCIKDVVRNVEISKNAGNDLASRVRELFICAEIAQALRWELEDKPYDVECERSIGQSQLDIYVDHVSDERAYGLEVKRLDRNSNLERSRSQVKKYLTKDKTLRRIYVPLIAKREKNLPSNNKDKQRLANEIKDLNKATPLIIKPAQLNFI